MFVQDEGFTTIIWRKLESAPQVTPQVTPQVIQLLTLLANEAYSAKDAMAMLGLSDIKNFKRLYLQPAIEQKLVEPTIPDRLNSRLQKYMITPLGKWRYHN